MKYFYVTLLLLASCTGKQAEVKTVDYAQVDSLISNSQHTIIKNDSIHKESEKIIAKTVKEVVSEIKDLKEEVKVAKTKTAIITVTKIDTVYIETKKNFWGREKTSTKITSDSIVIEDSINNQNNDQIKKNVSRVKDNKDPLGRDYAVYKTVPIDDSYPQYILDNKEKAPNFEWGETVGTIMDGKLKVYTDNKFDITDSHLIYFRKPIEIQFDGCVDIKTGQIFTADQECEFNDDVAEIIVDGAAMILAGDIESVMQYQREQQQIQTNS